MLSPCFVAAPGGRKFHTALAKCCGHLQSCVLAQADTDLRRALGPLRAPLPDDAGLLSKRLREETLRILPVDVSQLRFGGRIHFGTLSGPGEQDHGSTSTAPTSVENHMAFPVEASKHRLCAGRRWTAVGSRHPARTVEAIASHAHNDFVSRILLSAPLDEEGEALQQSSRPRPGRRPADVMVPRVIHPGTRKHGFSGAGTMLPKPPLYSHKLKPQVAILRHCRLLRDRQIPLPFSPRYPWPVSAARRASVPHSS